MNAVVSDGLVNGKMVHFPVSQNAGAAVLLEIGIAGCQSFTTTRLPGSRGWVVQGDSAHLLNSQGVLWPGHPRSGGLFNGAGDAVW